MCVCIPPGVPLPIAAMNKDDLAKPGEHQSGTSRQIVAMHPVAKAKTVGDPPDSQLGFRILAPNPGHQDRSLFRYQDVHERGLLDRELNDARARYVVAHRRNQVHQQLFP